MKLRWIVRDGQKILQYEEKIIIEGVHRADVAGTDFIWETPCYTTEYKWIDVEEVEEADEL